MNFDLTRLKSKLEDQIEINNHYQFEENLLSSTELISPLEIDIEGFIERDIIDGFQLDVKVKGIMILPCSVTLKPVSVPFEIHITGNLDELLEEIEKKHKKIENSIDILPIIWENILMEIPMKVTSADAYSSKIEGDGWKLVTDENEETINPALAQLKDLL